MYTPTTAYIYSRDDSDASGLSRQNITIIAACTSAGGLILCYFLYRTIRNCLRSANSAPFPPVQPPAHRREQHLARFEQSLSRPQAWFQSDPTANSSLGSKVSLLGKESPLLSPCSPPLPLAMPNTPQASELISHGSDQRLPLPSPSYCGRPGSSSSLTSSDISCTSPQVAPLSVESSSLPMLRSVTDLHSIKTLPRRARPLSTSSMGSYNTINSRTSRHTFRGLPHSPHNQVPIILPTPLAFLNNSRDSIASSNCRRQSGSHERRSVADAWLLVDSNSGLAQINSSMEPLQSDELRAQSRKRQRPVSLSSLRSVAISSEQHTQAVPPVPRLPANWETMAKINRSASDSPSRWVPTYQTVHEEDMDCNKREKRRT